MTGQIDTRLRMLADRMPALVFDLEQHLRDGAAAANGLCSAADDGQPYEFVVGRNKYLLQDSKLEHAPPLLADLGPGQRLVHVFHSPVEFLHALAQPGFLTCVDDPRWLPWLLVPLEASRHGQAFLRENPPRDWPWPMVTEPLPPGPAEAAARSTGRALAQLLHGLMKGQSEQLVRALAARPGPAEVLAAGTRPLRVLAVAGRHSVYQRFSVRDVVAGLRGVGVEARWLLLDSNPASEYELLKNIAADMPDLLFLVSRGRESIRALPPNLPVVSWDQDYCLCNSATYLEAMRPQDRLLVLMREWARTACARGLAPARVAHVNMGTNEALYQPSHAAGKQECEVLFIGSFHSFERYRTKIGLNEADEPTQRLIVDARERLRQWILSRDEHEAFVLPDLDALLRSVLADHGLAFALGELEWTEFVRYFRYRVAHLLVRELYVRALAEFDLRVHGRGWDEIPEVAPFARGSVENGPELCRAVQHAAVNVHLHTWTVHHPRLYDTAAAGGFQLVGRVPEEFGLEQAFDPQCEVDTFGSIAELRAKVRYYLANPAERVAKAARAAARARRDHSMQRRMADVLEVLRRDVPGRQRPVAECEAAAIAG